MGTMIVEKALGGVRWLVARGPADRLFRALGEHAGAEIRGLLDELPERSTLERYAASPAGAARLAAVADASRSQCPAEWAELADLAAGAEVDLATLMLLNLRGDLGVESSGIACSDLGWSRGRTVVAHNEDGDRALLGRSALLTLAPEGEPPVTVYWCPGMLPSNTFVATGLGLVWGIDHLPVDSPPIAPGRHFVARAMQRASTLDEAVAVLRGTPTAGGFAYTIGEVSSGRVATVEAAAGRVAVRAADPQESPLLWHTNHLRYLSAPDGRPGPSTLSRGETLAALSPPAYEPGPDWFLRVLATPEPDGVWRVDGRTVTLASLVADLTARTLTVAPHDGVPATVAFDELHG
jgi:hypothetical protein